MSTCAYLCGELAKWPDKARLASILQSDGLRVRVEKYSIRIEDFSHFSFEEYGGDLGVPQIVADAEDAKKLASEARRISDLFARAGLTHRFEIYEDDNDAMIHYFHHDWPLSNGT
jgi:hypothetical protein